MIVAYMKDQTPNQIQRLLTLFGLVYMRFRQ